VGNRGKMRVYSNLAMSVDGKIAASDRDFFSLGSARDLRLLQKLRDDADAIIFGSGVLRVFRKACLPLKPRKKIINAVLSRKLSGIDPKWDFFRDPRLERILYVTGKISRATRNRFSASSEIVEIGRGNPAVRILQDLRKRGVSRLGVEGGGEAMWPFVEANIIDEYFVTIAPSLIGGRTAPTLLDGPGFSPEKIRHLKLKSLKRYGSELFLVYTPVRD
jgi:5-amino-6-(5-phosphoribosylamino)uracil reductase